MYIVTRTSYLVRGTYTMYKYEVQVPSTMELMDSTRGDVPRTNKYEVDSTYFARVV